MLILQDCPDQYQFVENLVEKLDHEVCSLAFSIFLWMQWQWSITFLSICFPLFNACLLDFTSDYANSSNRNHPTHFLLMACFILDLLYVALRSSLMNNHTIFLGIFGLDFTWIVLDHEEPQSVSRAYLLLHSIFHTPSILKKNSVRATSTESNTSWERLSFFTIRCILRFSLCFFFFI